MIDWFDLAANSLWIFALALALAALSTASWRAVQGGLKFQSQIAKPPYPATFALAGLLFCLGLAGTAAALERVAWLALGTLFGAQLLWVWRRGSQPRDSLRSDQGQV